MIDLTWLGELMLRASQVEVSSNKPLALREPDFSMNWLSFFPPTVEKTESKEIFHSYAAKESVICTLNLPGATTMKYVCELAMLTSIQGFGIRIWLSGAVVLLDPYCVFLAYVGICSFLTSKIAKILFNIWHQL